MFENLYLYFKCITNTCETYFNVLLFINNKGPDESRVTFLKFSKIIEILYFSHFKNTLLLIKNK